MIVYCILLYISFNICLFNHSNNDFAYILLYFCTMINICNIPICYDYITVILVKYIGVTRFILFSPLLNYFSSLSFKCICPIASDVDIFSLLSFTYVTHYNHYSAHFLIIRVECISHYISLEYIDSLTISSRAWTSLSSHPFDLTFLSFLFTLSILF